MRFLKIVYDFIFHRKDHAEALTLQFDPDRVSYQRLLEVFWDYHDWTVDNATNVRSYDFDILV